MGCLGNLQVIDRLKTIEEVDSSREAVAIMERGGEAVGVGLRVNAAPEVIISVGATAHLWRKGTEDSITPVDLRITDGGLLYAHFGGVFHRIAHTGFEVHSDGVLGLDRSQGTKHHRQNEKVMFSSHRTRLILPAKGHSNFYAKIASN